MAPRLHDVTWRSRMAPGFCETWAASIVGCAAGISRSCAAMTFLGRAALQRRYTFVIMSPLIALLGRGSITTRSPDIFQRSIFRGQHHQYKGFAGTFPGTHYLRAVLHYSPIVMGTGSSLGMKRDQIDLPKQNPLGETQCTPRQSFKHLHLLSRLV